MLTGIVVACLTLAGCAGSGEDQAGAALPASSARLSPEATEPEGQGDLPPQEPPAPVGPTSNFVTVTEPAFGSFTVSVPADWDNLVYATVDGQIHRTLVTSVSPDGQTVIFIGDPSIPSYWEPAMADDITRQFAEWLDSMELASYVPAPDYLATYLNDTFGALPDYSVNAVTESPDVAQQRYGQYAAAGLAVSAVHVARADFSYTDDAGVPTSAIATATTVSNGGFWQATVGGIASTGNPDDYFEMTQAIASSIEVTPDFTAIQQQRHNQTMAQIDQWTREMTDRHEANMARLHASASAHQERMQAIWASNDAQMTSYDDRMQSSDVSHRQFLNYINEESTVQSTSGSKVQVQTGFETYWVNPSTREYVGGDVGLDEQALRNMGYDPSQFERMPVTTG